MDRDALRDEVRSAYNTVAEDYAARFPGTEPEQPIDVAMIDQFVSQLAVGRRDVLDAGCGTGRLSRYLTDRGCRVVGVDLSPGMIAMAQRDHPDIETQVASITELPFGDAHFGGIVYWYSTIHVADDDLAEVFREARRVLVPNGLVLVAFQVGEGSRDVAGGYRALGYDVTLTRFNRMPDQMTRQLADAGFVEEARLVRRRFASERDDQAFALYRLAEVGPSGQ